MCAVFESKVLKGPVLFLLCAPLLLGLVDGAAGQDQAAHPLVIEAAELTERLRENRRKSRELNALDQSNSSDEERNVSRVKRRELLHQVLDDTSDLVRNVLEQERIGLDTAPLRGEARSELLKNDERYPTFIAELETELEEARARADELEGEAKADVHAEGEAAEKLLDYLYREYLEHLSLLEKMDLPADKARASLSELTENRQEQLQARLKLSQAVLGTLEERLAADPNDEEAKRRAPRTEARLDSLSTSLSSTCDVGQELGLETAECRQLLVESTGKLTYDALDRKVVRGLLRDWGERFRAALAEAWPRFFGGLVVFLSVLLVFWVASAVVRWCVRHLVRSRRLQISELGRLMITRLAARTVLLIGFFVALSQVGVEVSALLAGLGIAGFIVGFALQDTLGNFAAGAMIVFYRPFDLGDTIEAAGVSGRVEQMNLVSTTILTFDNQTLVVPNNKIWGDVIRNVTAQTERRVDLSFPIAHDDDFARAEVLFADILGAHPKILKDPAPNVRLHRLNENAVEFIVRPWVQTDDYWDVYWDITREAKRRLVEEGFRVPATRSEIEIHHHGEAPEGKETP